MSQERPAFSVVIPTHQRCGVLPRAIRSVLGQSFPDLELLVVDDASKDRTAEVVAGFTDPRLIYVRREQNGGAAATRNTGILQARGELVCFLDDDDELLPDYLQRMHVAFGGSPQDVGLAWPGVRWVEDVPGGGETFLRDELWQPRFASKEAAYLGFLESRQIGTNCGLCFRRAVFEAVGNFDEELGAAEDTDLLVRVVRRFSFQVLPELLVKIHLHQGGHLRRWGAAQARAYRRIIEKNQAAVADHPGLGAKLHYKAGWLSYHVGDRSGGRSHMLQSLARRPLRPKTWLALLMFEVLGKRAADIHQRLSVIRRGRAALVPKDECAARGEADEWQEAIPRMEGGQSRLPNEGAAR